MSGTGSDARGTMTISLGRLESLDVREVWKSEPRDFTAWLAEAENLGLLGDALGLHLELEARERSVGPFAADIVARDPGQNLTVVIENQLEPTDHKHLGQIITYAAGVRANALVWIAPEFRDEHRAAIDWLNQASVAGFDFFAVQIEAYRIGDSLPAPRFNIVSKPNSWIKRATAGRGQVESEPTEGQQRWKSYWSGLKSVVGDRFPALSERATASGNWQQIVSMSKSRDLFFAFNLTAPRGGLRIELYIDGNLAKAAFRALEADNSAAESAFGGALVWEPLPDARACRICAYMPNATGADHAQPAVQYEWLIVTAPRFIAALRPFVDRISPTALAASEQAISEG